MSSYPSSTYATDGSAKKYLDRNLLVLLIFLCITIYLYQ